MNFKLVLLLIIFYLYSCRDYEADFYEKNNIPETTGKEIIDGDPEPLRPNIEKGMQGLYGVDSDGDGVRDDVEIWINRNIFEESQRKYYKEYARYSSREFLLFESKVKISKEYILLQSEFMICGTLAFNGADNDYLVYKKFHKIFYNTNKRTLAYSSFRKSGEPVHIISGPTFERYKELSQKNCPWDKETNEKLLNTFLEPMRHNLKKQ